MQFKPNKGEENKIMACYYLIKLIIGSLNYFKIHADIRNLNS